MTIDQALHWAATNPREWHDVMQQVEISGPEVIAQPNLPAAALEERRRPPLELIAIELICETCAWNVNDICEHTGCSPCRQRHGGGLKELLKLKSHHCPIGNF